MSDAATLIERLQRQNAKLAQQCREIDTVMADNVESARNEAEFWREQTAVALSHACTGNSSECAIRQHCTNKCGRLQQLDDALAARSNP